MFAPVYTVTLILAAFAQFAFADTCSRQYTVKNGDTCDKISQDQQISTYQLNASNPGLINSGCTNLMVGQTICLALANQDCSTTYAVLPGDTCDKISAANGISLTTLRQNNPQLDPACDIDIGQVLCVSKKVQVLSTKPPDKPTTSSPPTTASSPHPITTSPPPTTASSFPTTASSPSPTPSSFPTTTASSLSTTPSSLLTTASSPPPTPTSFPRTTASSPPTTTSSPPTTTSSPPTTASSPPTTSSPPATTTSPPTTTSSPPTTTSPPKGTTITFPPDPTKSNGN